MIMHENRSGYSLLCAITGLVITTIETETVMVIMTIDNLNGYYNNR